MDDCKICEKNEIIIKMLEEKVGLLEESVKNAEYLANSYKTIADLYRPQGLIRND